MNQRIGVLGGGVAGVNVATFLDPSFQITILEAAPHPGGLARSFAFEGFHYDVGPHIIFSRKKELVDYMVSVCPEELGQHRRSNQIWYKGLLIKYPFENFLGLLPPRERDECVHSFLNNPYESFPATNMLQFFLKNFGSGITNTYLRPYNEKIWKFDPSCLDLQMVERIPKPPAEDIVRGAKGDFREGYTHQLMFHYPKRGGIQTFYDKMVEKLPANARLLVNHAVTEIRRVEAKGKCSWEVRCANGENYTFDQIVNCLPLHELFKILKLDVPAQVDEARKSLLYNSLYFGLAVYSKDAVGDNFALNIPQPEFIFHRLSKVNFIGQEHPEGKVGFLYEITLREKSYLAQMSDNELQEAVIDGIERMGAAKREDLIGIELRKAKYGYVIYDLLHRSNTDKVLGFLRDSGIPCSGRFAEHEYVNMDQVIERAMALCKQLNEQWPH